MVESPTYPNAAQAVRHAGARLVPATVDPDGWDLDALGATLRQSSPRLAYLIPDFQNPTGHLMPDAQREELASALARTRTVAVADEAHQALALTPGLAATMPRPLAAYADDTITIGSASKSYWGGLRLGWIRAPRSEMDRLIHARIGMDLGAPVFEQLVLADLMDRADEVLPVHRERLLAGRDALVRPCASTCPSGASGCPTAAWRCGASSPSPSARRRPSRPSGAVSWSRPDRSSLSRAGSTGTSGSPGPVLAGRPSTEAVRRLAAAWDHVSSDAGPARDAERRRPGHGRLRSGSGRRPAPRPPCMAVSISASVSAGMAESTAERDQRGTALVLAARPACRRC